MIYDNEYCLKQATWLVDRFSSDREELIKQISGELNRLYRLGQCGVLDLVKQAVSKADKLTPR